MTRLTNNFAGGTAIDFNYADYDKVGNRLSMKISDANTQIYGYDKLYQLTAVDYNDGNSADYDYDKLGNRRTVVNGGTTAYTSNAINQYEAVAGTNYTYDKNGNLTYDGVYRYYYDCENRLTDVNNAADAAIVSYKYDYRGRRVARTTGTTTITYLYDGDQIIADYSGAAWQRRYYYGPSIDQPICMVRTPGATGLVYYYHYDGLGSVAAMSAYNGVLIEKYTYDVYGNPTIKSSTGAIRTTSAYNNPYMFTGREYDPNVGLYYYRARYYSPKIGRFLQTDPVGYYDSMNLYQYCGNNPVNWIDPWGEDIYRGSRGLNGGSARWDIDPGAHQFLYRTDSTGKVTNTWSWGNDFDKNGNGKWCLNRKEDMDAAKEAQQKGWGKRLEDDSNYSKVNDEFKNRVANGPYHPWLLWNNCRTEARSLWDGATRRAN